MELLSTRNIDRIASMNKLIECMNENKVSDELQKKIIKVLQILKSCGLDPRLLDFDEANQQAVSILMRNKIDSKQVVRLYATDSTFSIRLV